MTARTWPVEIPGSFAEQQKQEAIARLKLGELLDHEPECSCRQIDVDLFDARGCELHDLESAWNMTLRAVTDRERCNNFRIRLVREGG